MHQPKRLIFFLACFLVLAVACSKDKFSEARKLVHQMIETQENFIKSLKTAKDSKEVVSATQKFSNDFTQVNQEILDLGKKYPELKQQKMLPEDLKPLMKKSMDLLLTMSQFMQMAEVMYKSDPSVKKAFEEMARKIQEY